MNQSIDFLKDIDDVWKTPIPKEIMARAKKSLLDYLAVTCAGSEFQKDKLKQLVQIVQKM